MPVEYVIYATNGRAAGAMWTGTFTLAEDGKCRPVWVYDKRAAAKFGSDADAMEAFRMAMGGNFHAVNTQSSIAARLLEKV